MARPGSNLFDPLERDALMLFDGKRVVGSLQNDPGAQIAGTNEHMAADFVRFRITAYPRAKPAEARRLVFGDRRIGELTSQEIGACRMSLSPGCRFEATPGAAAGPQPGRWRGG